MIWMTLFISSSAAEILINEVLYNPDGTDGPSEWIELCNNGEDDVDISSWEIQSAGSSWSESWTFSSGALVSFLSVSPCFWRLWTCEVGHSHAHQGHPSYEDK